MSTKVASSVGNRNGGSRSHRRFATALKPALSGCFGLTLLLFVAAQLGFLTEVGTVPVAAIQQQQGLPDWKPSPSAGHDYAVPVASALPRHWFSTLLYPSDSADRPDISKLRMFEDGKRIGPAHSVHQSIFEQGDGRYSNWNGTLFFSSSDNSDPRTNGRTYQLRNAPELLRLLILPAALCLVLAVACLRSVPAGVIPGLKRRTLAGRSELGRLAAERAGAMAGRLKRPRSSLRWGTALKVFARGCLATALLLLAAAQFGLLTRIGTVPTPSIQHQQGLPDWKPSPSTGHDYAVPLDAVFPHRWFDDFLYPSDSSDDAAASRLHAFENGKPLGPAHSMHQTIFEQGEGAFSNWTGNLYWATSDNSDPRTNGRIYQIRDPPNLFWLLFLPSALCLFSFMVYRRLYPNDVVPELAAARLGLSRLDRLSRRPFLVDGLMFACLAGIEVFLFVRNGIPPWERSDGWVYVHIAEQFASGIAWTSVPDYYTAATPLSLFRIPGYPLLIMIARFASPDHWVVVIVLAQTAVAVIASYVVFRTTAKVSNLRVFGMFAAIVFMVSDRAEFDRWIITDSFYTSLLTIVICRIVWLIVDRKSFSRGDVIGIGSAFAVLFLLRELTPYIAVTALPLILLVLGNQRGWIPAAKKLVLIYLPLVIAVAAILGWNFVRVGTPVITVGAVDSPLFRLVEAAQQGVPVFAGADPLDVIARSILNKYDPAENRAIYARYWAEQKVTPPQLAKIVTARYFRAWMTYPAAMLSLTWRDLQGLPYVFWPYGLTLRADGSCEACNAYGPRLRSLAVFCLVDLPIVWTLLGVAFRGLRRRFLLIAALYAFIMGPSLIYAAIHFEIRYALFAIAPLMLILGMSIHTAYELATVLYGRLQKPRIAVAATPSP